jgi:hypothetical protein
MTPDMTMPAPALHDNNDASRGGWQREGTMEDGREGEQRKMAEMENNDGNAQTSRPKQRRCCLGPRKIFFVHFLFLTTN